jgi:hypothetical protein
MGSAILVTVIMIGVVATLLTTPPRRMHRDIAKARQLMVAGVLDSARTLYNRALHSAVLLHDNRAMAQCHCALGEILAAQGRTSEASNHLEECLEGISQRV